MINSGFAISSVQLFFMQKISFDTFGVSIHDFFRNMFVWVTLSGDILGVIRKARIFLLVDLREFFSDLLESGDW